MGVLSAGDRAAGALARAAATLAQLALVSLGVHLAADRLDDHLVTALVSGQAWLDAHAAPALHRSAHTVGIASEQLLFWDALPVVPMAAGSALALELAAIAVLAGSVLLTPRDVTLSWARWRASLCIHAVVLPTALAGVLLAGSWSMAMATEDLLPASPVASVAAALVGIAVFLRIGGGMWARAVAALDPGVRWTSGWAAALLLVPVGGLAWSHGVPVWGLVQTAVDALGGGAA